MPFDKELLERFYDKQEQMAKDLSDIKVILAKQEENLKLHIYRTELAEQNIELLREQLKPIENHVKIISGITKIIAAISIIVGITLGILEILQYFK